MRPGVAISKCGFASNAQSRMLPPMRNSDQSDDTKPARGAFLRFGKREVPLPGTKTSRTALGGALVAGGIFSFLPVLGLWMLPLGALVLSVDHHPIRRARRRFDVRWGRYRADRAAQKSSQ
jgi:hypothetical protein